MSLSNHTKSDINLIWETRENYNSLASIFCLFSYENELDHIFKYQKLFNRYYSLSWIDFKFLTIFMLNWKTFWLKSCVLNVYLYWNFDDFFFCNFQAQNLGWPPRVFQYWTCQFQDYLVKPFLKQTILRAFALFLEHAYSSLLEERRKKEVNYVYIDSITEQSVRYKSNV